MKNKNEEMVLHEAEAPKQKIDWARKFTSRKFWLAIVNLVTNLLIAFNVSDNQIAQVSAIILAAGGLIAYIVAEGFIDAKAVVVPHEEIE